MDIGHTYLSFESRATQGQKRDTDQENVPESKFKHYSYIETDPVARIAVS